MKGGNIMNFPTGETIVRCEVVSTENEGEHIIVCYFLFGHKITVAQTEILFDLKRDPILEIKIIGGELRKYDYKQLIPDICIRNLQKRIFIGTHIDKEDFIKYVYEEFLLNETCYYVFGDYNNLQKELIFRFNQNKLKRNWPNDFCKNTKTAKYFPCTITSYGKLPVMITPTKLSSTNQERIFRI